MQSLLRDRFGMKLHNEDRPVDVYALVATKPKLKKADPGNRSDCQNVASTSAVLLRAISCQNTTMEQFAAARLRMAGARWSDRGGGLLDMRLAAAGAGPVESRPIRMVPYLYSMANPTTYTRNSQLRPYSLILYKQPAEDTGRAGVCGQSCLHEHATPELARALYRLPPIVRAP